MWSASSLAALEPHDALKPKTAWILGALIYNNKPGLLYDIVAFFLFPSITHSKPSQFHRLQLLD